MNEKSILEQALLQVQTLEEAVKANAKGILASTMKQELNDLLKESMEDEEMDVEEQPEPKEKTTDDMSDDSDNEEGLDNDESEDSDDDTSKDIDSMDSDDTDMEDMEDMDMDNMDMDNMDDTDMGGDDDVVDMSSASDSEVLKIFKAMSPEDGIIVKKDGDDIEFSDGDNEYIIKLDDEDGMEEGPVFEGWQDEISEYDSTGNESSKGNRSLIKSIWGRYFDEISNEIDPSDFGDAYDFAENFLSYMVEKAVSDNLISQKESDRTIEKMKDMYDENLIDMYGKPDNDDEYDSEDMDMDGDEEVVYEIELDGEDDMEGTEDGEEEMSEISLDEPHEKEMGESSRTMGNGYHGGIKSKTMYKSGNKREEINEEVSKLKKQNGEYKKALVLFKEKLNEVAVFNANLAYATRLFTEVSTTRQEKLNILKRFDTISTLKESKNLYSRIKTELETKKPVTESVVDKITSAPSSSSTQVLSESKAYENPQFKRMKDLMQKIK
jgi:hypothetical protein